MEANYPNIQKYILDWENGHSPRPLAILIGGAAGTGKSTLQEKICEIIPHVTQLSTGTVRAVLRSVITEEQAPELFELTYKAWKFGQTDDEVWAAYERQCLPVLRSCERLIEFSQQEMQSICIEGAHFIPDKISWDPDTLTFPVVLQITDEQLHRERMSGPTHQRTIGEEDFLTARFIQDKVVQRAVAFGQVVLESDDKVYDNFMSALDNYLLNNMQ